jgi:transposase InsO family protein
MSSRLAVAASMAWLSWSWFLWAAAWRICRDNAWWSRFGKPKRYKGTKPGAPSHDDLVRRDFTATAPNVVWVADLTEHWTDEGKLYCCAIKDLFSNRIVGYSIDSRMKARLVVAAIEMAVARRGGDVAGCILHSDRGSQFRSRKVHRALARHGMVGSMGQVGSAGDNAAMESFFALLQKNVLDRQRRWATREQLRIEIVTWIERTYHRRRRLTQPVTSTGGIPGHYCCISRFPSPKKRSQS